MTMKAYSITYDLKAPDRDYKGLYEAIKGSGQWWHYLESTWLVVTNSTSKQIWDQLSPYIDRNDNILIIEIKNNAYGLLPKDAWDWIAKNVPR